MSGIILLGEVAKHLATLEIVCRSGRKGRLGAKQLLTVHGP
jgi:hypothetical protein